MHALIDDSPYDRTPGAWLMAMYIDGTPGKIVGLYCLMCWSTCVSSNTGKRTIVAAMAMGMFIALVMP